jgi:hypothetical protein
MYEAQRPTPAATVNKPSDTVPGVMVRTASLADAYERLGARLAFPTVQT